MCCWGEADHSRHPHSICCLPSFTRASRHLPPIHGICLRFISSLDALVLPLCGLNFLHTPPTYCNLFLACLCFFTFCHSLNCHAFKINPTNRNPFTCSVENLVQNSGGSKKQFNHHGNSANTHYKDK